MVNWPIITGLIGIGTIFGFLAMLTICGVYRVVSPDDNDGFDEEFPRRAKASDTTDDQSVMSESVAGDGPDSTSSF